MTTTDTRPYLEDPEYIALLAKYDPSMRDADGNPATYAAYERFVRQYVQGKAARRRYRKTEKGKAARRKWERKVRAHWRAHKAEFKAYIEEKRRAEGLVTLEKLTLNKYERKKEYNRERYHRVSKLKKLRLAESVRAQGPAYLVPDLDPAAVREFRSSSPPAEAPRPRPPAQDSSLSRGLTPLPITASDLVPLSPELIAWYASDPRLRLPEPNAVDDRGPLYFAPWARVAEGFPAEHAAWLALREHVIEVTAEVRARGLRVDKDTAPSFADPDKPFRFVPLHSFPHQGNGRGEPSWCRFCSCRFQTPLGLRKDVNAEVAWPNSPLRCAVLPDIPDSVFWPSGHPDGLSPPDNPSSSHSEMLSADNAVRPVREPGPGA